MSCRCSVYSLVVVVGIAGCDGVEVASSEAGEVERLFAPVAASEFKGPRYGVSGSVLGTAIGECGLWACGEVHELGVPDFAIEVGDDPCTIEVICRSDGQVGTGPSIVTRGASTGPLSLRYPTSSEMHVLTAKDERDLQAVADLFRRLSIDPTRSEARRAELAAQADHAEHQIRRAQERRGLGE